MSKVLFKKKKGYTGTIYYFAPILTNQYGSMDKKHFKFKAL